MPTDVETLMEMGFSENRAQKALAKTQYKGVQVAMDWLFAHNDDPDIDEPFEVPQGRKLGEASATPASEGSTEAAAPAEVKSLKCDDCGKRLRTAEDVQIHAARTSHQSFSESTEEIKPLTEEEKKEQLARLQARMQQKQEEKKKKEEKEKIEKEKMRRKEGRDIGLAKQQMELEEAKRQAAKKKKEKEEERLARQRVKEQIAQDRANLAAKRAGAQQQQDVAATPASAATTTATTTQSEPKKDYDSCRLQIRLPNGAPLTQTFKALEPLAAVRVYVELNRTDGAQGPFQLMTTFPRKVFTSEDMEKPLKELGLVPSAVLMVTRPQ